MEILLFFFCGNVGTAGNAQGNSGFLWHRKEGDATLREEQMKESKKYFDITLC